MKKRINGRISQRSELIINALHFMTSQSINVVHILTVVKDKSLAVLKSSVFHRWYFFFEVVVLGICVLLIWLMILMALRSNAFWKLKASLKSRKDPKKLKK